MWSVADAKAQLSEILRRARAGEPQFVGAREPCVVISAEFYRQKIEPAEPRHDGRRLIDIASRVGFEIPLPDRSEDREPAAFGESA